MLSLLFVIHLLLSTSQYNLGNSFILFFGTNCSILKQHILPQKDLKQSTRNDNFDYLMCNMRVEYYKLTHPYRSVLVVQLLAK